MAFDSNYYRCNVCKDGVSENTFPHRSTGEPVIGLGPRPAKVALWKGIFFHFEFSKSTLQLCSDSKGHFKALYFYVLFIYTILSYSLPTTCLSQFMGIIVLGLQLRLRGRLWLYRYRCRSVRMVYLRLRSRTRLSGMVLRGVGLLLRCQLCWR